MSSSNVSRGFIPEPQPSKTYRVRHEGVQGGSAREPVTVPMWAVYELTTDDARCIAYTTSQPLAEALKARLDRCVAYDDAVNSMDKEGN